MADQGENQYYYKLLERIDGKLQQFRSELSNAAKTSGIGPSVEATNVIDTLEMLRIQISKMDPARVGKLFFETMLTTRPCLTADSIAASLNTVKPKRGRTRTKVIPLCKVCGSEIVDDVCSNPKCAISTRSIGGQVHKGKVKDAMSERITEFPKTLDTLLGIAELPPHFTSPIVSDNKHYEDAIDKVQTGPFIREWVAKVPDITPIDLCRQYLVLQSKDLVHGIMLSPDDVREGMRYAGLYADYQWANAVRYKLTGYRPKDYCQEDRDLMLSYYRRALDGFFNEMHSAEPGHNGDGGDEKKSQKNQWSIQSIIKLIMYASPRLMNGHSDFYESLHIQNMSTEKTHAAKWEKMARAGGWKFV